MVKYGGIIMADLDFLIDIIKRISELGRKNRNIPLINEVKPFKHYFSDDGKLKYDEIDDDDEGFSRREILARYLLVNVVLDQGPDIIGVRMLLRDVTTNLYEKGIKIFHNPLDFFKELDISINEILTRHKSIKDIRAEEWAMKNNSTEQKYNLFFAQSNRGIVSTKQVLDYSIHRWGVPLSFFLLLEKDYKTKQPLIDYLESWESAEIMAQQLKDHERYGLGSAIGDKACHLFAKMYINIFNLVKNKRDNPGWSGISYEIPFDSNAGRVLFRTGFLLKLATLEDYENWEVIQKGEGKGRANYIRVTNIRGKKTDIISQESENFKDYREIITKYLKIGMKPKSVEIQRIPNFLIYKLNISTNYNYSIADFDDGLIYIGTNYCFNHENPNCDLCPLQNICKAHNEDEELIKKYTT